MNLWRITIKPAASKNHKSFEFCKKIIFLVWVGACEITMEGHILLQLSANVRLSEENNILGTGETVRKLT